MEFKYKDFENLYNSKIRYPDDDLLLTSKYFFCYFNKIVLIKKSRKGFKVMVSPNVNIPSVLVEQTFNCVAEFSDLIYAVHSFKSCVQHILHTVKYEEIQ